MGRERKAFRLIITGFTAEEAVAKYAIRNNRVAAAVSAAAA